MVFTQTNVVSSDYIVKVGGLLSASECRRRLDGARHVNPIARSANFVVR